MSDDGTTSAGKRCHSDELARILSHSWSDPTATLLVFSVRPAVSCELYVERLRALISAAVMIARDVNFDDDSEIALDSLPEWFRVMSDAVSAEGSSNYLIADLGDIWDPAEWIYCFDPDLRAWTWWDVTVRADGVAVWIDTLGEPHVPHGELLWALYVSGADRVDLPYAEDAAVWVDETDIESGPD
ncbi:hypothetical protein [Nocardia sp. NPDC058705]|uniref:hypothetical protein n=1 Tax=Nocardia sp. NPDC058705 TaxID=3346609 RepID=UPI0036A22012